MPQVFWAAKCVKLLRSKVFLLSKVFFEAKCASAVVEDVRGQTDAHVIMQEICNKFIKIKTSVG